MRFAPSPPPPSSPPQSPTPPSPPPTATPFLPTPPPSPWLWALLPLSVLLVAAVVLFVLCYRRFSRDRANFQISRDRANMDLQMMTHKVKRQPQTETEGSVSLPDSLPTKRFTSLRKPTSSGLQSMIRYDCFLTHDWGEDEAGRDNHARVARVSKALKAEGLRP
eukprot:scaffold132097_cov54-Phaeocystis_antarctica.AAC.2